MIERICKVCDAVMIGSSCRDPSMLWHYDYVSNNNYSREAYNIINKYQLFIYHYNDGKNSFFNLNYLILPPSNDRWWQKHNFEPILSAPYSVIKDIFDPKNQQIFLSKIEKLKMFY